MAHISLPLCATLDLNSKAHAPCAWQSVRANLLGAWFLLFCVCALDTRNARLLAGELVILPQRIVVSADYPARLIVLERHGSQVADPVTDRTSSEQLVLQLPDRSGLQVLPGGIIAIDPAAEPGGSNDSDSRIQEPQRSQVTIVLGDQSVTRTIEIAQRRSQQPVFPREVAAVLGKSGCNLGTCHGNLHGKAGFRLSLRGDDPAFDFNSIVRAAAGRRVDRLEPEQSLLLRKALGLTAHQGGARFTTESREAQILRQWIEAGCKWNAATGAVPPVGLDDTRPDETLVSLSVYPSQCLLEHGCRRQQLAVIATFADGTMRDVTSLARYEPSVVTGVDVTADGLVQVSGPVDVAISISYLSGRAASRVTFLAHEPAAADSLARSSVTDGPANSRVDELVENHLRRLQVGPQPLADDYVFARRAYLKIVGRLPTAAEVLAFANDNVTHDNVTHDNVTHDNATHDNVTHDNAFNGDVASKRNNQDTWPSDREQAADKYERLVDQLLSDRGYALLWALRWSDLLRNEQKVMSDRGAEQWHAWMTEQIAADRPLDQFVTEMLTTLGSTYDHPAASFHRTHRDPETAAESIGQVFLGVRLQCARCHNHPFDKWRQDDYYGLAAYFTTLDRKQLENDPKDKFDKHIISGDEVISYKEKMPAVIWHPGRSVTIEPKPLLEPRISLASSSKTADKSDSAGSGTATESKLPDAAHVATTQPLEHLAQWLTANNRMFARNMANRIWYHIMSIGIVDPPDDFRDSNPASNPELLEYLTDELIRSGYSTRHVSRLILTSRAFRRASVAEPTAAEPLGGARQFGGYPLHRMPAEVLYDAISDVTGVTKTTGEKGEPLSSVRAVERVAVPTKAGFLTTFGKPGRLLVCECERSAEVSLGQSLVLVNGLETRDKLAAKDNLVQSLIASGASLDSMIDTLYLTTLSRPPSGQERIRFAEYVKTAPATRPALEDILWALMNSKEFPLVR